MHEENTYRFRGLFYTAILTYLKPVFILGNQDHERALSRGVRMPWYDAHPSIPFTALLASFKTFLSKIQNAAYNNIPSTVIPMTFPM